MILLPHQPTSFRLSLGIYSEIRLQWQDVIFKRRANAAAARRLVRAAEAEKGEGGGGGTSNGGDKTTNMEGSFKS
jgi:hypothetical protein